MKRHFQILTVILVICMTVSCNQQNSPDSSLPSSAVKEDTWPTLPELLEEPVQYAEEHSGTATTLLDFQPAERVDPSSIQGKVVCGFQGWFCCTSSGCPLAGWMHWSNGTLPCVTQEKQDNMTVEMFPDISDYLRSTLNPIAFKKTGDDKGAMLFSSCKEETIDTQFSWMKTYGIDGVALQRFLGVTNNASVVGHFNLVAEHVRNACEKYGRVFYLTYDLSGTKSDDWIEMIQRDFEETITGKLGLTDSPQYLHEQGKPVIQLWGLGVKENFERSAEECTKVIDWFQKKGYYVIGGTPSYWRESTQDSMPNFQEVYDRLDMISPWTVGRFNSMDAAVRHYDSVIAQDMAYCQEKGIDYMPVVYPGFAWSKWNGGDPNVIPRKQGEFMWQQMKLAAEKTPTSIYIAMFDEYDEATAIMKAASDSYMVPRGSYFLTLSADGQFVSSDFYLRLVGTFTDLLKKGKVTGDLPVPKTVGPVWLRTGFEKGMDPIPDLFQRNLKTSDRFTPLSGETSPPKITTAEHAPLHKSVLSLEGHNAGGALYRFSLFDTEIPVTASTKFRYIKYCPVPEGTRAYLDLLFSDGTSLSGLGVTDYRGLPVTASQGSEADWIDIRYNLGPLCAGKMITEVLLCYDGGQTPMDIEVLFDDLVISDAEIPQIDLRYNNKKTG